MGSAEVSVVAAAAGCALVLGTGAHDDSYSHVVNLETRNVK